MEKQIIETKQLRKDIDEIIQRVRELEQHRETCIVVERLQEAVMWLGMNLKRINKIDPYEYKTVIDNEAEEWAKNYTQLEKKGWEWIEDNTRQGKYKRFCRFRRRKDTNPYPDSYNPNNTNIEPTADGLKL